MTTYTKTEHEQDPWPILRQFVGQTIQFEAHRADGIGEAAFGVLHGVSRSTVDGNTQTAVHVGPVLVRLRHRDDGWLFYPFDAERPDGWEDDEDDGPKPRKLDAVAARYKGGSIEGYEEAEVVERLAPDAWRVVFTDGHSAGVFEHELRVRPGDIDSLKAMEVGVIYTNV